MQAKGNGLEERTARFAARVAPAGLSVECASVKMCKRTAFSTSFQRQHIGAGSDRWRMTVCKLAHLHIGGMSREDFIHKMKLAMKELAEARCWLRIIGASDYLPEERLAPLIEESRELTRMMGASVSTARSKMA